MGKSQELNEPNLRFEIISENFMVDGGRPLEVLDAILEQCRGDWPAQIKESFDAGSALGWFCRPS